MPALLPLESNPDVMTKFIHRLGVSEKWKIVDVYGLDKEVLEWVPKPVIALILLFPCSDKYYKYAEEQKKDLQEKGQDLSPNLFYMKQYISNACGTIALVHSIANNAERVDLKDGPFKKLLESCASLTPEQRGEVLLKAAQSTDSELYQLISAHQELALEGQTEVNPNDRPNHHFVAFIEKDGCLYELDGRKDFPINHGATTTETFLENAARVCSEYISRDSDDVRFTVMALAQSDD